MGDLPRVQQGPFVHVVSTSFWQKLDDICHYKST
jgi:hypothetical protein